MATIIDNYTIIKKLGGGACAKVYLARDFDGAYVAIKVLKNTTKEQKKVIETEIKAKTEAEI